ncbi:MAG: hypothetical protein ABW041_07215 [Dehalococcoides mccartyi]
MYEPTLKLTRQILEELQESRGTQAECGEVTPGNTLFKDTIIFVRLPTIKKALELYENRPQWQDKPDKEGWWWAKYDSIHLRNYLKIVKVVKSDDEYGVVEDLDMSTVGEIVKGLGGTIKYQYIPEPDHTKEMSRKMPKLLPITGCSECSYFNDYIGYKNPCCMHLFSNPHKEIKREELVNGFPKWCPLPDAKGEE